MLQRVADQMESLQRQLSEFIAAFERRFAPLEPMPAKLDALEKRVAALEAIEDRAKGAIWLGRILLGAGAAAAGFVAHMLFHK